MLHFLPMYIKYKLETRLEVVKKWLESINIDFETLYISINVMRDLEVPRHLLYWYIVCYF